MGKINKIIKRTDGGVEFLSNFGIETRLVPFVNTTPVNRNVGLKITDSNNVSVEITAAEILNTQIEGEPQIPFSGDALDLWERLAKGFF